MDQYLVQRNYRDIEAAVLKYDSISNALGPTFI